MLTKSYESIVKLHTHTHTHTHNCYRQEIEVSDYTNFVKNVNRDRYMNLVKGDEFL